MYLYKIKEKLIHNPNLFFLIILLFTWALIYLPNLDIIPLSGIESRRISIAYSINDLRGLFKAEDIGRFYSNKTPIFSFILSIFINSIEGTIEFVSRLPSAISVIMVSTISLFRLKWLGWITSFSISLLFLIAPSSIYYGRLAEMDMIFSGLIYLSLVECLCFYENKKNKTSLISIGIMQGFAFLIKGPFGLVMLALMIYLKSVSLNEIFKICKVLFPIISTIIIFYFGFAILNNYLDFYRLIGEIYIRFYPPTFERFLGERIIAIFYSLPIIYILVSEKIFFYNQSLVVFCKYYSAFFALLLFLMPGFQADYMAPVSVFSIIPSGIILSAWLKSKKPQKFVPITFYFTINIILFIYIFPSFVGNFVYNNNSTSTFLAKINKISSPLEKKYVFFTSQTEFKAPYFYSSEENYSIEMLENIQNVINKENSENNVYFLVSNTKIDKTKELINNQIDGCFNIKSISDEFYREGFFSWPDKTKLASKKSFKNKFGLPLHKTQTLSLYKILFCKS